MIKYIAPCYKVALTGNNYKRTDYFLSASKASEYAVKAFFRRAFDETPLLESITDLVDSTFSELAEEGQSGIMSATNNVAFHIQHIH